MKLFFQILILFLTCFTNTVNATPDGKFVAVINNEVKELSGEELGTYLSKNAQTANVKEIVLQSCNDLESAKALAEASGKAVYTTDGKITLFDNGVKRAEGTKWYRVEPDGTTKELTSEADIPVKECTNCNGDGIEMGAESGSSVLNNGGDFINGLVDANKFIQEGKFIEGVKKIDLMGGKTSQLGGEFANIDILAEKGIKGSVTDLDKFIKPSSIDEIICNNPQAEFLGQVSKVLKKDAEIYVNGTARNSFFNSITQEQANALGFELVSSMQPLNSRFQNLKFFFSNGTTQIPNSSVMTTILKKK
jgi:predicted RecA/RadA family phage recombinase